MSGGPDAPLQLDDDVFADEVREEGLWVHGLEGHRGRGAEGGTGTRGVREGQLEPFAPQTAHLGVGKIVFFEEEKE